jgi:hypothetical protein
MYGLPKSFFDAGRDKIQSIREMRKNGGFGVIQ